MEEFAKYYKIIWSAGAFIVAIIGIIFRKWTIDLMERGFLNFYNRTGFHLFKRQAEEIREPYIRIFITFVSVILGIAGILNLLSIFGIYDCIGICNILIID